MQSVIDAQILNDFFGGKPILVNTFEEQEKFNQWKEFKDFIKVNSDLVIVDSGVLNPDIYKLLTDGRGEAKLSRSEKKINTHGGTIKGDFDPATFFCLLEPAEDKRKKLRSSNGYLIAFEDDYYKNWCQLSFHKKNTLIAVDRGNAESFKSWDDLAEIVLPFTDVILCDPFILSDISLIQSNLLILWEKLDSLTPVKYNFLIITHEGTPKKDIKKEFERLNEFRIRKNLKGNLSLVFTTSADKEHDRNLFMNYLRLKSGDSFNFFDSKKSIITKGTEIDIYPSADPQKEKATSSILKRVTDIIKNASEEKVLSSNKGKIINRLLVD